MPSPRPKPTHLKVLAGNPGHRKLNTNEPKPTGDLLDPPEWFTDTMRAGWAYAIASAPAGLLKRLDRSALVAFVVAEDQHRRAALEAAHSALVQTNSQGRAFKSQAVVICNECARTMLKAAVELGFSPSARSKVTVDPKDAQNEFDD